jgi:hypothetical protein
MYVATLQKSPERNMIRGVPPPPFRSDSHVAHKSSFSIVGTNDSRRKFDLIVYFADYPQTDFSATKKWRITESRQERPMAWRIKNRKFEYLWSRFTLKQPESPGNEGHYLFNIDRGVLLAVFPPMSFDATD